MLTDSTRNNPDWQKVLPSSSKNNRYTPMPFHKEVLTTNRFATLETCMDFDSIEKSEQYMHSEERKFVPSQHEKKKNIHEKSVKCRQNDVSKEKEVCRQVFPNNVTN